LEEWTDADSAIMQSEKAQGLGTEKASEKNLRRISKGLRGGVTQKAQKERKGQTSAPFEVQ